MREKKELQRKKKEMPLMEFASDDKSKEIWYKNL